MMKDIFLWERKISTWKALCLQLSIFHPFIYSLIDFNIKVLDHSFPFLLVFRLLGDVFHFHFSWSSRKVDHAGIMLDVCLVGISFHFNWYDIRHADEED